MWLLPLLVLLLAVWRVPWAGVVQRQVGMRALAQAIIQSDQLLKSYHWLLTVEGEAEALEQARQHLAEANIKLDARQAQGNTYRALGLVALAAGDISTARAWLQRAASGDVFARFFLGATYLREGRTPETIEAWRAAGARDQLMELAEDLLDQERQDEALVALDAASQVDANYIPSRQVAGRLLMEIDRQRALELYQELVEIKPDWAFPHFRICQIWSGQGLYEPAIPFCERALQLGMENRRNVLELLGRSHAALGQWDEAVVAYEQAIEAEPAHHQAYALLGDVKCRLQQVEEARFYYEQAAMLSSEPEQLQQIVEYIAQHGQCPPEK